MRSRNGNKTLERRRRKKNENLYETGNGIVDHGYMVIILAESWAHAEDVSSDKSKWEFHVIPYFWMAGIDGDATVKGGKSDADLTLGDIWDNLDFGGQSHLEAWKGRWGIFLNPTLLKLSDDADAVNPTLGPVEADITVEQWLVEFGGFYGIDRCPGNRDSDYRAFTFL